MGDVHDLETGRDASAANADDRGQIADAIGRFAQAYNAGDTASLLGYYADDLIKLRDGAAPETRAEAASRIAQGFRDFQGHLDVTNEEILVSGDMACTRGSLRLRLTPRAGGPERIVERRYLEIWRKREGQWLVFRTMDNLGAPAAANANLS